MPVGTITALRAQDCVPERVNVFIDDEFAIGVSLDTLAREELFVGKAIAANEWARLESAESVHKAVHAALRLINARPRSIAEIRERLRRKDFSAAAIDAAVTRLIDLRLLDDAAFSRFWIENRQNCRPRSVRALRNELRRKGVERETVEATLRDEQLNQSEADRALALARGALRRYADAPDRATFQRRLGGYLQRRGFSFDVIAPILEQLWSEVQPPT